MIQLSTPPQQQQSGLQLACSDGKGSITSESKTNKRTRSVSPERTAKRPHLCLSRKLSYSSALREAQNASKDLPASPGFPSLFTVASSLASSLRTANAVCCTKDGNTSTPQEDHLVALPQNLHCEGSNAAFILRSAHSDRPFTISPSKRIHSLKQASSPSYDRAPPSTSKTLLEDFLAPRPSPSRYSSSESIFYAPYIRTDSEEPDSRSPTPSGLVGAFDEDSDAMDEDIRPDVKTPRTRGKLPSMSQASMQRLYSESKTRSTTNFTPQEQGRPSNNIVASPLLQEGSIIFRDSSNPGQRTQLMSPNGKSKDRNIRYSMGVKKGCVKCARGEKGHFTHLEDD